MCMDKDDYLVYSLMEKPNCKNVKLLNIIKYISIWTYYYNNISSNI